MQILIIGKTGQVASSLTNKLVSSNHNFLNVGRSEIDLLDKDSLQNFLSNYKSKLSGEEKNVIINASAYTNVELAEDEPEKVIQINGEAPKIIADFAAKNNILYVDYSSDYIFDGTKPLFKEDDKPGPLNIYGKSKILGEENIISSTDNYLILRTSWVFSAIGKNFVKTIRSLLLSKPEIKVINDQIGRPTSADFIADITLALLDKYSQEKKVAETINVSQASPISWYGFAAKIKEIMNQDNLANVIPVTSSEFKTKAIRPQNSVLSTDKLEFVLGAKFLRSWEDDLREVIMSFERAER